MNLDTADLFVPRILVVDDERQIHASLRLRLGSDYRLVCCTDAREALAKVATEQFDLCFADIHMPHLDGLAFIQAAKAHDPNLGYVVVSAFDSDENLRRAIPLQIYDFIPKPLPDRDGFERRVPEWVERTRTRRREHALALKAGTIENDLETARLEREVEFVASETARDALLQCASLLTTIHAHLVTGTTVFGPRGRSDSSLMPLLRNLEEARKTSEAAVAVTSGFFDSGYGNRDTSPALVASGLTHAISIAVRKGGAAESDKRVEVSGVDDRMPARGLTGIDFLLMMVPAIGAALARAQSGSTVRIHGEAVARLDAASKDPRYRRCVWINRKYAVISQPGIVLTVTATGAALANAELEAWLKGADATPSRVSPGRLMLGTQKCRGLLGIATAPESERFLIVLALPV